jgi:hypothetical protein
MIAWYKNEGISYGMPFLSAYLDECRNTSLKKGRALPGIRKGKPDFGGECLQKVNKVGHFVKNIIANNRLYKRAFFIFAQFVLNDDTTSGNISSGRWHDLPR